MKIQLLKIIVVTSCAPSSSWVPPMGFKMTSVRDDYEHNINTTFLLHETR
jgi:hypothetical protein